MRLFFTMLHHTLTMLQLSRARLAKIICYGHKDQAHLDLLRRYVVTVMTDSYRASSLPLMRLMPSTASEGSAPSSYTPSSNFAAIAAKISAYAFTAC